MRAGPRTGHGWVEVRAEGEGAGSVPLEALSLVSQPSAPPRVPRITLPFAVSDAVDWILLSASPPLFPLSALALASPGPPDLSPGYTSA